MLRQKVGVGERQRYERVDPSHSWNSNNIATNVLLYHLQRHSDHHANPTRRYQTLRDFEESPGAADRVRRDDRARHRPRHLAPGDGPAGARPLRRRHVPRQHPAPQARQDPRARTPPRWSRKPPSAVRTRRRRGRLRPTVASAASSAADEVLAARCPGCDYAYDVVGRRRAGGLRGRHRLGRHPGHLVLPGLRGARQGRLRAGRPRRTRDGVDSRRRLERVTTSADRRARCATCASGSSRPRPS